MFQILLFLAKSGKERYLLILFFTFFVLSPQSLLALKFIEATKEKSKTMLINFIFFMILSFKLFNVFNVWMYDAHSLIKLQALVKIQIAHTYTEG